jgi:hypothetical protein
LAINKEDKATEEACTDIMRSGVRQLRYRLKKKYFIGVPADQIRTTSPVPSMTDEQWRALVAKWTDPKNMVPSHFKDLVIYCLSLSLESTLSFQTYYLICHVHPLVGVK